MAKNQRKASQNRARGFVGVTRLRRKLRRMDQAITADIRQAIAAGARDIEQDMVGGAPVDEGDLVRSIAHKVSKDGFAAAIGPGAGTAQFTKGFGVIKEKYTKDGGLTAASVRNKHIREQLYKARWIEFGTQQGKPGSHPQPARPFMQPAFDANKHAITRAVHVAINTALKVAADG